MKSAYVYLQLYRLFDTATPLNVDCGELCNSACCHGTDSGMLLFPGEEAVYKLINPDNMRIEKTDLTYTYEGKEYKTPILFCDGQCDRYIRPLACRIFPLTPVLDEDGKIDVIIDPRAKSVCPLAKALYLEEYEKSFVRAVKKAFVLLSKNKRIYEFLKEYTEYINDFKRFF